MPKRQDTLHRLQKLAEVMQTALITYKKVGEDFHSERLVEPYSLTFSGPNYIILTWQLDPALDGPAWRNFRLDRIGRVSTGNRPFAPRIPVTIHLGEIEQFEFDDKPDVAAPSIKTLSQRYFECIETALLDGVMTNAEVEKARFLGASLPEGHRRAIHAQVYANAIGEVCLDGYIEPSEEELLSNMRFFLSELGWSP